MPIKVSCACGKNLSVKDEIAGRRIKCPDCGKALSIPKPKPPTEVPADEWDLADEAGEVDDETTSTESHGNRRAGRGRKRAAPPKATGTSPRLIIGLAACGAVLVIGLFVWMLRPKAKPEAENVAAVPQSSPPTTSPPTTSPGPTDATPATTPTAVDNSATTAASAPETTASVPPSTGTTTPEASNTAATANNVAVTNAADLPPAVLTRSLNRLPDWVAADAPFDVTEFWVAMPKEQNAVRHYLDAFFEFTTHLMPPLSPQFKARAPSVEKRYARSIKLQVDWHNPNAAKNRAERDAVLDEHAAGFQKLFEAQKQPCVFEVGWDVPAQCRLILTVREVARVAQLQVERDIERNDFDAAIRMIGSLLRLSRDLRVRAPLALHHSADAVDSITLNNLLIPLLKVPTLKVSQCDELAKLMSQHAESSNGSVLARLKGDYLLKRMIAHAAQHETGVFQKSKSLSNKIAFTLKTGASHELLLALLNPELVLAKDFHFATDSKADMAVTMLAKSLTATDLEAVGTSLKEKYHLQAETLGQPYATQVAAFAAWRDKQQQVINQLGTEVQASVPKDTPPAQMEAQMMTLLEKKFREPNTARAPLFTMLWGTRFESDMGSNGALTIDATRNRTWITAAPLLVALRRWYATHRTPPSDLAAMCREAGIATVPNDPYGNSPFKLATFSTDSPPIQYERGRPSDKPEKFLAGECIIYSVGPDGLDDRAAVEVGYLAPGAKGDWSFTLGRPQSAFPPTP